MMVGSCINRDRHDSHCNGSKLYNYGISGVQENGISERSTHMAAYVPRHRRGNDWHEVGVGIWKIPNYVSNGQLYTLSSICFAHHTMIGFPFMYSNCVH